MLLAWTVRESEARAWLYGSLTPIALSFNGRDLEDPPPAGPFVVWVYELEGQGDFRELMGQIGRYMTLPNFRGIAWQGRHAYTAAWGDEWAQESEPVPGDAKKYLMRPANNQFWRIARYRWQKYVRAGCEFANQMA